MVSDMCINELLVKVWFDVMWFVLSDFVVVEEWLCFVREELIVFWLLN